MKFPLYFTGIWEFVFYKTEETKEFLTKNINI